MKIPIAIPVSVRTGSDWGLRFSVTEISQQTPLRKVKMTVWGVPLLATHNPERFQKGSPGNPPGCEEKEHAFECISTPGEVNEPPEPLIDNPTVCTGERAAHRTERPVLPGTEQPAKPRTVAIRTDRRV